MFTWALAAGRRYITVHPCRDLQEMPAKGERKRVLNLEEIRIFWHGLDRTDLPFPRGVALGLKFELATMLRSIEFRTAEVAELKGLGTRCAHITVPLERVKKRRVIEQPLSTLAQEIIVEAMRLPGNPDIVFRSVTGIRLSHAALADALNGVKCTRRGKTTRTPGLCEILGLPKFTPHDLRRTAASVARELQCRKADIAACLDHSGKGEEAVAPVSNIYMRQGVVPWSRDLEDKRIVLETLAEGLREAIGLKPPKLWAALNVDLPPLPPELERLVA
jgi:integrase